MQSETGVPSFYFEFDKFIFSAWLTLGWITVAQTLHWDLEELK